MGAESRYDPLAPFLASLAGGIDLETRRAFEYELWGAVMIVVFFKCFISEQMGRSSSFLIAISRRKDFVRKFLEKKPVFRPQSRSSDASRIRHD